MFLTCILTFLAEVVIYTIQIFFCNASIQMLEFTKVVFIEIIYNAFLIAIIYPLFLALGVKFESDFAYNSFLKF